MLHSIFYNRLSVYPEHTIHGTVFVVVVVERVVLVAVVGVPSIDITVQTTSYELLAELLD